MGSIEPAAQPWEVAGMSLERQVGLYRDWGLYFSNKNQVEFATRYYDRALQLEENDCSSLYFRSQSKRCNAQAESAIHDARLALDKTQVFKAMALLEVCSCIYELNEFEKTKAELFNGLGIMAGSTTKEFERRLCVVEENIKEALGPSLKPFIMTHSKLMEKVDALHKKSLIIDDRPLWKTLRDEKKCDIISILEEEKELLSPREVARRKVSFNIYNQAYLNRSWIDVLFIKNVRKNSTLLLPYTNESTPFLRSFVEKKYQAVSKFIKMLHSRSPMYNVDYVCYPNRTVRHHHRQSHLYRVQHQTRRNMVNILRDVKFMRQFGNINNLCKYIEDIMGDYVSVKTHRVMPWKLEFVHEIYNSVGLAYTDKCVIPKNAKDMSLENLKRELLGGPNIAKDKQFNQKVEFVVKKPNQDTEGESSRTGRSFHNHFDKRMIFSQYDIEKSYLYHEIAKYYLEHNRFDECCSYARKGMAISNSCKSNVWSFLNCLMIIKAHSAMAKSQNALDAIDEGLKIAQRLQSTRLEGFLLVCQEVTRQTILKQKDRASLITAGKRSNKSSVSAFSGIL